MSCWRPILTGVKRVPLAEALQATTTHEHDYITPYVDDLGSVIDMQAIAGTRACVSAWIPWAGRASTTGSPSPRSLRSGHRRGQSRGRSDLFLHDR